MSKGRLLAMLAVLAGVAGFAWMSIYGLHNDPRELPSALLNKAFPEVEQPMLGNSERMLTREDFIGKPALVNVWATWCPTCRAEHGYFNQLAAQGVPIYGINYKDDEAKAIKWLQDLKDPYVLNVNDPKGVLGMNLGVYGAPETFIIDSEGVIRFKFVGAVDDWVWKEKMAPIYEGLLNQ